jgi:hypothetical protein
MSGSKRGAGPRVSVVLAVHNGEEYLAEAMRSILTQELQSFEFIVVDDGSTDGSARIIRSFADPRIRLLTNATNCGLTPSLNRGLAAARGEFIARLDADDVSAPTRLSSQVAFLEANPDVALVGTGYHAIDERGRRRHRGQFPADHLELRWSLLFYCAFTHSAVMWRRAAVEEAVGRYDEAFAYAMDWEYWSRIASRLQVSNLARPLTRYRIQAQSMSATHPRVAVEIAAARVSAMGRVFGEDTDGWQQHARDMYCLVDGWAEPPGAADLRRSTDTVRALHGEFCQHLDLTGAVRRRQEQWALRWIGRRLLTLGRKQHLTGNPDVGRLCFAEVRRISPRSLLAVNFGRYLAASALGRARRLTRAGQGAAPT